MRTITQIIWHCSATREGQDVKLEAIRRMHTQERGWSDVGYHFVIELDGTIREGRPLMRPGAHVSGRNEKSIGICYIGGCDPVRVLPNGQPAPKDTRTPEQKAALYQLTDRLLEQFPNATVHGHREFAAKACPSFDVQKDWQAYKASGLSPWITPGLKPEDMRDEDFEKPEDEPDA